MTTTLEQVQTEIWEPNPDKPGYMRLVRAKTVQEVYEEIRAIVGENPDGGDEYFTVCPTVPGDTRWPGGRIVVFSVNGSSEGDYTHVEVSLDGRNTLLLLGKTFMGRDASWQFARRLADILGA